jgi:hypothetical protein
MPLKANLRQRNAPSPGSSPSPMGRAHLRCPLSLAPFPESNKFKGNRSSQLDSGKHGFVGKRIAGSEIRSLKTKPLEDTMWIDDFRGAYRSLRSRPGFTATAILSLGIGIGGSVAMFTLVNSIVLKPLAYHEPDRLVTVRNYEPRNRQHLVHEFPLLALQFIGWKKHVQSFDSIALTRFTEKLNLTGSGWPETLGAMRITAGFFDTLGVRPQRGRWFAESEEKRGMPNVVILSDGFWRRRFSADPHIVGKKIILNDAPYEVVGITPPNPPLFRGYQLDPVINLPERTDVLLPIRFSVQEGSGAN